MLNILHIVVHEYCTIVNVHVNSKSHSFYYFMLVPEGKKYGPTVSELHIAPKIIWQIGSVVLNIVYFLSNLFPGGLLTCCVRTTCCCTGESSDNSTLPHCQAVQSSSFLEKSKRLNFIAVDKRDLLAGLCDCRPNSLLRRR